MTQKKYQAYLDGILEFLKLDFNDLDSLLAAINAHEPEDRVKYDAEKQEFRLGMASWDVKRMTKSMETIREAVIVALEKVVADGLIGEAELEALHQTQHDLVIQHVFDPDSPSMLNLNYIVPDGKIAWETGLCPHCREDVTIHLFPDPVPLLGYEAIINTLRLLTRSVKVAKTESGEYQLAQ